MSENSATLHSIKPASVPKRRVLIVEDDLDSVHSMVMLIRMMGHEVRFAINGFVAIDIARTWFPDVILLDIGLPDFKGDEIARQLKFQPGLEHTRMIAISGLPLPNLEERATKAGCSEFYTKPIEPSKLEELLAEQLKTSGRP